MKGRVGQCILLLALGSAVSSPAHGQYANMEAMTWTPPSISPYVYQPACVFQVYDETAYPFVWAFSYLFVDGQQRGQDYQTGWPEVWATASAQVPATPADQTVVCRGQSLLGSAVDSVTLPGVPSGEYPSFFAWDNTLAAMYGYLEPSNVNYGGRKVIERNPGSGGPDTCWFFGSTIAPQEAITSGEWDVYPNNGYGPDFVGWNTQGVNYYRSNGRAPCGTQQEQ